MKPLGFVFMVTLALGVLSPAAGNAQVGGSDNATVATTVAPAELPRLLRNGGYTIYFRHAATEPNSNESNTAADDDCMRQRNLSAAGREQSRGIGTAIRKLNIPIGRVIAGPLCRTRETARLIFGRTQIDPEVRGGGFGQSDYPGLRALVSAAVPAGINQAIVGHGGQFQKMARTVDELGEGDAAIIKGLGDDKFEIVTLVRGEEWAKLK